MLRKRSKIYHFLYPIILIVALCLVFLPVPSSFALQELSEAQQQTLKSLAKFLQANQEELTYRLDDLGYRPSLDRETWEAFPSIRKVEAAYVAANEASSEGGDRLLRALAHQVATNSEAAKSDRALQPLLASPVNLQTSIKFSNRILTPDQIRLDVATQSKILAIVNYADGGLLGGASGILQFEMDLHPDQAYDILRSARSNAEAIAAAAKISPIPPPLAARLAEIATEMAKLSQAVRSDAQMKAIVADATHLLEDRVLADAQGVFGQLPGTDARINDTKYALGKPLASELRPFEGNNGLPAVQSSPSGSPLGGGGGVAPPRGEVRKGGGSVGKGGAPGLARGATEYSGFWNGQYRSPGSRRFIEVVQFAGGFGGIIFGAEVVSASGTKKPKGAFWTPLPPSAPQKRPGGKVATCTDHDNCANWGRILVQFSDGSRALSQMVRAEDVYAARCIVFGGCPRVDPANPGEGIPLVGLTDLRDHIAVEGGDIKTGSWFRVIINPAIDGRGLGRAAVAVDGMATKPMEVGIIELVAKTSPDAVAAVEEWLQERGVTWKVTDVPMEVAVEEQRLSVLRRDGPQGIAKTSFLNFVNFGYGNDIRALLEAEDAVRYRGPSSKFPAIVPILARSIGEVARINDFAQILGLIRWTKSEGIEFHGPTSGDPGDHIGSVSFYDGKYSVGPDTTTLAHSDQSRRLIERALDADVSTMPSSLRSEYAGIISASREAYVKGQISKATDRKLGELLSNWPRDAASQIEDQLNALVELGVPDRLTIRISSSFSAIIGRLQEIVEAQEELDKRIGSARMTPYEVSRLNIVLAQRQIAFSNYRRAIEKEELLSRSVEDKMRNKNNSKEWEIFLRFEHKVKILAKADF